MPSLWQRARSSLARAIAPSSPQRRSYSAAQGGRLYADWFAAATSSDSEIRASFRRLVDRSRDLERNNDYVRGYLGDCEDNIVGSIRDDLRMDCGEYGPVTTKDAANPGKKKTAYQFQPDRLANSLIEQAWTEWSRKGTCTVCGRYSWLEVKRLLVRATARDGNFIARKIRGPAAGNRFQFALQLWEIDHLDYQKFQQLPGGGEIRFGVETDAQKRVVAYWLQAGHPGDYNGGTTSTNYRSTRFPASEIYHVFVSERTEQTLGLPWMVSAITRLRQLGAFEEAATIAARLGAANAIFFETDANTGGGWAGDTSPDGRAIMDVEPGTAQELPAGWKVSDHTPTYPNITTGDFRKAMLRGIATGAGVSYTTLGNDLESVNFSSARVGLFDERETWKKHQLFFSESFYEPVFGDWLEMSITVGEINLPIGKFAKFNRPRFKARRWPFIDPLKEVEAAKVAIALRISSRRAFIEEGGGDVEDVFHDNVDDENLATDLGLDLQPPDPSSTTASATALLTAEDQAGDTPKAP